MMGPRKLVKLDHRDRPKNPPKERGPQPLCHSSTLEGALEYRERFREFLDNYYRASGMWLQGVTKVEFPRGSFKPPTLRIAA